jgi:hypothetical protein
MPAGVRERCGPALVFEAKIAVNVAAGRFSSRVANTPTLACWPHLPPAHSQRRDRRHCPRTTGADRWPPNHALRASGRRSDVGGRSILAFAQLWLLLLL